MDRLKGGENIAHFPTRIARKSARRLEISAVLVEFSKRLVNFCTQIIVFFNII